MMASMLRHFVQVHSLIFLLLPTPSVTAAENSPKKSHLTMAQFIKDAKPGDAFELSDSATVLYHWLSVESAKKLQKGADFEKKGFPLKRIDAGSALGKYFRNLVDRPALYAWSNPVAGMGSGGSDFLYGDHVIKLWRKSDAKVVGVVSESFSTSNASLHVDDADILFHVAKTPIENGYSVSLQEYLILNPKIVENFTGDPTILKSELSQWKKIIAEPDFLFPENELHSQGFIFAIPAQRKKFMLPNIEKALSQEVTLPQFFLRTPRSQCTTKIRALIRN